MGKGDRKRKARRQQAKQQLKAATARGSTEAPQTASQPRTERAVRPTPERMARGKWTKPHGIGKDKIAVTDLCADMVAYLYLEGAITKGQEQAARTWQEIRARYEAELPEIAGYRSCIDPSVPGYDDGDGDPDVIEAYRAIECAMTMRQRREVLRVCWQGERPAQVAVLREALDVVAGK